MGSFATASGRVGGIALLSGAAVWFAVMLVADGESAALRVFSNGSQALAAAAAAAFCLARARRATADRAFWQQIGFGAALWSAGQVAWTVLESALGEDTPFPSVADVGFLACSIVFIVALLGIVRGGVTGALVRVRATLDGALIAGSLLVTSWLLVLGPASRQSDGGALQQVVSLAYPVLDVFVLSVLVYVQARTRRSLHGSVGFASLSLGLGSIALADTGFALSTLHGWYSSTNVLPNGGWVVGFVLIALSSLSREQEAAATPDVEPASVMIAPYAALILAFVASVVGYVTGIDRDPFVFALQALLSAALMTRQVVTLTENRGLTTTLERRVAERTAELEQSARRFRALVLNSSDVISVIDANGVIVDQSESVTSVFGYDADLLVGRPVLTLVESDAHRQALRETIARAIAEPGRPIEADLKLRHADGSLRDAVISATSMLDDEAVHALVLNTRDVTEERALAEQLRYQAFHDPLTGLANRALFHDRLGHSLARRDAPTHVLHLDVDQFKEVNDALGHAYGDRLLVTIGERLQRVLRQADTLARLGGDEFAVLLDAGSVADAERIADELRAAVGEPIPNDPHAPHVLRASVGIASALDATVDADTLMRDADLAMYDAKSSRSGVAVYTPALHDELVERLTLSRELPDAIANGDLVLDFQPTIALDDGRLLGVEALVRWQHPTRGRLGPGAFVPIAERSGLIADIGRYVLARACRQAAAWSAEHPDAEFAVNVNITAVELRDVEFVAFLEATLAATGLPPRRLVLELTETTLVAEFERCAAQLDAVRTLGVRVAIDDFGSGYSSLTYVGRLPIDILKIDRGFISGIDGDERSRQIVETIVSLAHSLEMTTVAEGIETAAELAVVQQLGCDVGQGYHLGRPQSANAIVERYALEQAA